MIDICTRSSNIIDKELIKAKRDAGYNFQKQNYLKKLADEYSNLMAVQLKKVSQDKLAEPIKNSVRDLQNNIHAVEVQLREAGHVRVRYKLIRQTLLDDAGRFEGNIKTVDEELRNQSFDIDKLQEV